jgi:hypothetical protein
VRTSYFSMWAMLGLMAFGAVGGALFHGNLFGSIRDAFPSDSIKQGALHRCGQMDAKFSRFSEQDRDACYRVLLPADARVSSNANGEW